MHWQQFWDWCFFFHKRNIWRKHLHSKTPEIMCSDYLLLTPPPPPPPLSTGALIRLLCVYAIREALFQYGGRGSWSYYCADAGTPTPSVSLRRSLVRSASSAPRRLNSDTRPRSSHQMRMPSGGHCPPRWQSHLFSFFFSFFFNLICFCFCFLAMLGSFHWVFADVDSRFIYSWLSPSLWSVIASLCRLTLREEAVFLFFFLFFFFWIFLPSQMLRLRGRVGFTGSPSRRVDRHDGQ